MLRTNREKYNDKVQNLYGIQLRLIVYTDAHFQRLKAKRFLVLFDGKASGQNLWIPNSYLLPDGTIDSEKDLRWLFKQPVTKHKLKLAGYIDPTERITHD